MKNNSPPQPQTPKLQNSSSIESQNEGKRKEIDTDQPLRKS